MCICSQKRLIPNPPKQIVKHNRQRNKRFLIRVGFERLECRIPLAFGIAHVTPDLTDVNKLFKTTPANVEFSTGLITQPVKPYLYGFSKGSNDNPDNPNSPVRGFDDVVIAGDWGGTGFTSVGVAQNADQTRPPSPGAALRFLLDTDRDTTAEYRFRFGFASDKPVVGNFDGLYGDDISVVRASDNVLTWYVTTASNSLGQAFVRDDSVQPVIYQFRFGQTGDIPLTGKFDNDQIDDLVVVRNAGNELRWNFYLSANRAYPANNAELTATQSITFGAEGLRPIVGDWNSDGQDDIGVINAVDGQLAVWDLQSLVKGSFGFEARQSIQFGQVQAGQANVFLTGNWAGNYFNGGGPALVSGPNDTGNSWSSAAAWSEGRPPNDGETVVIEQPASVQITFDTGSFTGNLVTTNRLNVIGGELQLGTLSNLADVSVSGGTFKAAGNLTPTSYTQSNGTLEVLADEALGTASLNISGGTVRSTIPQSTKANVRLSNAIQLSGTVAFESQNDSYLVLGGAISGSGSINKDGPGFLFFPNGTGSHNGTITVREGTLIHDGSSQLNSIVLNRGALELYGPGSATTDIDVVAGVLLVREATAFDRFTIRAGTQRLANPVTANTLEVLGGSVTIASASSFGTTDNNGGTLLIDSSVGNGGTLRTRGNGRTVISAPQSFVTVEIDGATIQLEQSARINPLGNAASLTITNGSLLSNIAASVVGTPEQYLVPNAISVTGLATIGNLNDVSSTAALNYIVLSGLVSGGGGLRKVGSGSVLLTANNSYSGSTTIDDGELIASHSNALGVASSGVQVNGTGTNPRLGLFGSVTIAEPISVATGGRVDLRGGANLTSTLTLNSGSSLLAENGTTVSGLVTLVGNASFDSLAVVSGSSSPNPAIISGQVTGSGRLTVNTRLGLALQFSNANNNYLGGTLVAGTGQARLGVNQAIPSSGSLTVDSGAELALGGFSQSTPQLLGSGRIDLGGGLLNVDSGSFSGVLAGAGIFRKSTAGTLTLSGLNTAIGSIEVLAGTLAAGAVATLPSVPISLSLGANLDILSNSQQVGAISGNGSIRGTGGTLIVNNSTNGRFDGTISGALGIRKQGTGTWTLGSSNSFTGGTQVSEGSLILDAVNALGVGSLAVSSGASVDLQQNQQVVNLNNAGAVRADGVVLSISGNLTNTSTATFASIGGTVQTTGTSGDQTLNFGSASPGAVTIAGGSRVELQSSGTNIILSGSLNVQAGTLDLNNKIVVASVLTLDGNATISGAGQLTSNSIAQLRSGTVAVALAGSSGVRKSGSETVVVSADGVYLGSTTVEQGTLDVQVSQGLGQGAIDVGASGVLRLAGTHSISQLDNAGSVVAPSATMQLTGNLTNSGTFSLGTLETFGTSGTTQQVQLGADSLVNLTSVGAANVQLSSTAASVNITGSLAVQGGSIDLGDEVVSAGRVVVNGGSTTEIRGTGSLTSSAAFDLRSGTVAVLLRGSAGVTKSTAETVSLLASNSFTGPVTIQAGTLIANAANSIAGTVTANQGTTLDIRGPQSIGTLQNSGTLIANSSIIQLAGDLINTGQFQPGTSNLVLVSTGSQTINLGNSGAHSITSRGGGTISLQSSSNAIELSGQLIFERGRMQIGSNAIRLASLSLDGDSVIEGAGSVTSTSDYDLRSGTVAVVLNGSVGIRKSGSGAVSLQVSNSLTGSTILVDNGSLSATASNSLPSGNLEVGSAATLAVASTQSIQSLVNQGTINAGSSTLQVRGNFSSPGTFNAGSGTIVMNGSGEQLLQAGANQLSSLTVAGQGNVIRLTSAGTALNLTGQLSIRSGSLEVANTEISTNTFLLDAGSGDAIRGSSSLVSASDFDVRNGVVAISLAGTAGLRKSSAGTVRLDVPAGYQGATQIIEGSLLVNTPNAIPTASPISVGRSGTVDFGNFSAEVHSIASQGNVRVGEAELSLANDLINESSGTFTADSSTLILNGSLINQGNWPSPGASLTWEGTNDLQRLQANNATFSSVIKSSAGELIVEDLVTVEGEYRQLSGDLRLTSGDLSVGTLVWNQGVLNSDATDQSIGLNIRNSATFETGTLNAPIQGGSVWTKSGEGEITFSAPIEYELQLQVNQGQVIITQNASLPEQRDLEIADDGSLNVQAGTASFANVNVTGELNVGTARLVVQPVARNNQITPEVSIVSGTVSGSSGLLKLGAGTLAWSGFNQIAGTYEIDDGIFELTGNSALAASSSLLINELARVSVVGSSVGNSSLLGEGELSVGANSQFASQGGVFSGAISGSGIIAKQGPGDLELTRQSLGAFNGNLNVQSGSLTVNGNFPSARTNVDGGATLRGGGQLGDTTILSGGSLSPGNSPGIMTLANLNLESGAALVMELEGRQAGETYDQLAVTGDAKLNGNLVVQISPTLSSTLSPIDFFDLITFATIEGTPSLSLSAQLGNLNIRSAILPGSYRLIVEAPVPPTTPSNPDSPEGPQEETGSADGDNVQELPAAEAYRDERASEIILYVSTKEMGSQNQATFSDDPTDIQIPPISNVISEADAAVAAIDKAMADGLSMDEATAIVASVKPLTKEQLESLPFPELNTVATADDFPKWTEPKQPDSEPHIEAIVGGIATTVFGLGLVWFAYRRTKLVNSKKEEAEQASISSLLNRRNASGQLNKSDSTNTELKEEKLWTNN